MALDGPHWSRRSWLGAGSALVLAGCASAGGAPSSPRAIRKARERGLTPMIYFLGGAKVMAVNPETGAPVAIVDQSPRDGSRGNGLNDGIAIDQENGHIYWSNMGRADDKDGWLSRCELDGSNVEVVVKPGDAFTPKQMRVDTVNMKLWWSDREGMAVMRSNFDGTKVEAVVRTGLPDVHKGDQARWCVGLALDTRNNMVYWSQKGGDNTGTGTIRRAPMQIPAGQRADTRTDIETLFSRMPEPIDLELDLDAGLLYWSDRGDNTISRAPLIAPAGYDPARRSDRQILVTGLKEAIGIAIDKRSNRMAYTSLGGEVGIADLDGKNARMLATGQGMLTGVTWLS
jgi:hypothetical protein